MDIDIDLPTTFDATKLFEVVRASMVKNGELVKHPVGVYFQRIAEDPITGLAAIPYKDAEQLGYFKIDLLHLSLLDYFNSKEEMRALLKREPNWNLLKREAVVQKLFQINKQFELVNQVQPRSVETLADCIALIRPSKRPLINTYVKAKTEEQKEKIRRLLYSKPQDNNVWFKKAHAVAYALTIVLQMHLIEAEIL